MRKHAALLSAGGLAISLLLPASPASAAPTRYEAESATISQGVVEANHLNYSGTGFVNGDNVVGSYTQWTVNAANAGTATITIRYSNGTTTNRPADIAVNGTVVAAASAFNSTTNWDTWANKTLTAPVNAGSNTIRVTGTTANGPANLDYLDFEVASAPPPVTVYQAEDATLSQAAVASNHTGFTGTGFVDYTNITGSYVQWTVTAAAAGSQTMTLRYSNGTTANRPMDISVNGTVVAVASAFGSTTNWDTWADKTLTATLNAGSNTVRATATTASGGPNVDKLTVTGATGPPDTQAPTAPGSLASTGVTSSSVSLSWTASTDNIGVTAYDVYNGASVATTVAGTSGTVTGLTPSTAYTFTVKARDAAGNTSPASNSVTATTSAGTGGPPTAAELLAKVTTCTQISNGKYKTDSDVATATIPVCQKTGAVYWKADMDIDCDGIRTAQCNEDTDCCFLPDTACHASNGSPLNAAQLPYVVVPSSSSIWNYANHQIGCGTVAAIIYNNQVLYAVVGDTGPAQIIGEASYASAAALGINPDPSNGGTDSGVTYIFFQGSQRVTPIENHNNAVTLGQNLARTFVNNN